MGADFSSIVRYSRDFVANCGMNKKPVIKADFRKLTLKFRKPAITSRGSYETKDSWYMVLRNLLTGEEGIGEASPLKDLSVDGGKDITRKMAFLCDCINNGGREEDYGLEGFPSISFALETARLDLEKSGKRKLFDTGFYSGELAIPINGLIWMAPLEDMLKQVSEKIDAGYSCLKFKIGGLDFDEECRMLEKIRKRHSAWKLELRTDANGAFTPDDALQKLKDLSRFELHSIEQPVKAGQYDKMEEICLKSKIPVALDEELIGIDVDKQGATLLANLRPSYIILKPTMLGGLESSEKWITQCRKLKIGYWSTSALESNIGLNAIAQWASTLYPEMTQGLGTGQLFENNIPSPLLAEKGFIRYQPGVKWKLDSIYEGEE
jgi:O-succinylbenzoate synthase